MRIGASEDFNHLGGNFVKNDGSGNFEIAGDTHGEILGWADLSEQDASATEGATLATVDVSVNSVYRIPINAGTYTYALRGKACDLSVSSNMQGAQLNASDEDTVIVVDGNHTDGWVDVRMNPNKIGATGVA